MLIKHIHEIYTYMLIMVTIGVEYQSFKWIVRRMKFYLQCNEVARQRFVRGVHEVWDCQYHYSLIKWATCNYIKEHVDQDDMAPGSITENKCSFVR